MPLRANNSRENRYALLANDSPPKSKRSKTTPYSFFPDLPHIDVPNPKYIVMAPAEENKSMSDYSCFAVYKSIQLITKETISISQLRDGNLLILTKDSKIADKFISSSNLLGVGHIKCKLHEQLNTTRGTVYAPYLNKIPEEEIVNELKSQGVTSAFKFNKYIEGKPQPSGVILLSFNSYHLPSKINISWNSVKVREHIPNPMRCKNCQILGHTAKWCKNNAACVNCNLPPHPSNECTRTFCANCSEPHPASSSDCQKFKQQKEILAIKIKNKCTMQEAKQIHRSNIFSPLDKDTASYASVVSNTKPSALTKNTSNSTTKDNSKSQSQNSTTSIPSTKQYNYTDISTASSLNNLNSITNNDNLQTCSNTDPVINNYSPPTTRKNSKLKLARSLSSISIDLTDNEISLLNSASSTEANKHQALSLHADSSYKQ